MTLLFRSSSAYLLISHLVVIILFLFGNSLSAAPLALNEMNANKSSKPRVKTPLPGAVQSVIAQPSDIPPAQNIITPMIVGGTDSEPNKYPWMVALLDSSYTSAYDAQFCGGTLIREDLVLTAAHCVINRIDPSSMDVAVGIRDLNNITAADRIPVTGMFMHPDFDYETTFDNDIAVLRLARPVPNAVIANIADPAIVQSLQPGDLTTAIGWGALFEDESAFTSILQQVQVPYVDPQICQSFSPDVISENQFCAAYQEGGKDTCNYDSGGPLLYNDNGVWSIVGITSWGYGCARADSYSVYTKASNYIDWIINAANNLFIPAIYTFYDAGVRNNQKWKAKIVNLTDHMSDITDIKITGDRSFQLKKTKQCRHKPLDIGARCGFIVKFKPRRAKMHRAHITISTANGNTVGVRLNGLVYPEIDANFELDTVEWDWYSGGNATWHTVADATRVNGTALVSGSITNFQQTTLMTYRKGAGTLSFDWKTSSPEGYIEFYVDGEYWDQLWGHTDWSHYEVTVGPGKHDFAWTQYLYFEFTPLNYENQSMLDNVSWTKAANTPGTVLNEPSAQTETEDEEDNDDEDETEGDELYYEKYSK